MDSFQGNSSTYEHICPSGNVMISQIDENDHISSPENLMIPHSMKHEVGEIYPTNDSGFGILVGDVDNENNLFPSAESDHEIQTHSPEILIDNEVNNQESSAMLEINLLSDDDNCLPSTSRSGNANMRGTKRILHSPGQVEVLHRASRQRIRGKGKTNPLSHSSLTGNKYSQILICSEGDESDSSNEIEVQPSEDVNIRADERIDWFSSDEETPANRKVRSNQFQPLVCEVVHIEEDPDAETARPVSVVDLTGDEAATPPVDNAARHNSYVLPQEHNDTEDQGVFMEQILNDAVDPSYEPPSSIAARTETDYDDLIQLRPLFVPEETVSFRTRSPVEVPPSSVQLIHPSERGIVSSQHQTANRPASMNFDNIHPQYRNLWLQQQNTAEHNRRVMDPEYYRRSIAGALHPLNVLRRPHRESSYTRSSLDLTSQPPRRPQTMIPSAHCANLRRQHRCRGEYSHSRCSSILLPPVPAHLPPPAPAHQLTTPRRSAPVPLNGMSVSHRVGHHHRQHLVPSLHTGSDSREQQSVPVSQNRASRSHDQNSHFTTDHEDSALSNSRLHHTNDDRSVSQILNDYSTRSISDESANNSRPTTDSESPRYSTNQSGSHSRQANEFPSHSRQNNDIPSYSCKSNELGSRFVRMRNNLHESTSSRLPPTESSNRHSEPSQHGQAGSSHHTQPTIPHPGTSIHQPSHSPVINIVIQSK